jgi:hypothetical protein
VGDRSGHRRRAPGSGRRNGLDSSAPRSQARLATRRSGSPPQSSQPRSTNVCREEILENVWPERPELLGNHNNGCRFQKTLTADFSGIGRGCGHFETMTPTALRLRPLEAVVVASKPCSSRPGFPEIVRVAFRTGAQIHPADSLSKNLQLGARLSRNELWCLALLRQPCSDCRAGRGRRGHYWTVQTLMLLPLMSQNM